MKQILKEWCAVVIIMSSISYSIVTWVDGRSLVMVTETGHEKIALVKGE